MSDDNGKSDKDNQWQSPRASHQQKEEEDTKLWGILLFGLIGASATTLAVSHLRRTVDWVYTQLSRSKSSWSGGNGRSFRSSFQEDAWKRYNRRLQEEYEEEMERVERIRRMQNVFNRERNKYKRGYESWRENDPGAYHQHHQRDDWYWKAETFYREQQSNNHRGTPRVRTSYLLSHHYTVLGLDRCRKTPYTDAEIKTAFQSKAKQFHPDQNQDNKEAAEAKFKEVMTSYDAIKLERKSSRA
ncbi:dnaJ protein P58IPK homolog [Cucurbita moschata]|uniref:DnaJ protein P58IPK homolog n=2 Tax=Cucurbita TaxID=3660 RepID=A0A6J1GHD2_CUCMO